MTAKQITSAWYLDYKNSEPWAYINDAFTVEDGIFLNGGGNPIKRGFYKLILTTENTSQSFSDK